MSKLEHAQREERLREMDRENERIRLEILEARGDILRQEREPVVLQDMKEALSSKRKPDLSQVRRAAMIYTSRNQEYGEDKYQRGNYLRPAGSIQEAFKQHRVYLTAAMRHITAALEAMEEHQATDPDLQDIEGMQRAVYAEDLDVVPGDDFPPSRLPHIGGVCASMNMAIPKAVKAGLLPEDPGCPWIDQKDDD